MVGQKSVVATDDTIRGCLTQLLRGEITAAGVLADYLDEADHPRARAVRRLWDDYVERKAYWMDPANDFTYWKRTRWEQVAWDGRLLRRRVAAAFGKRWQNLPLKRTL